MKKIEVFQNKLNKKNVILLSIIIIILVLIVFFIFLKKPDIETIKDSVVMIETFDEDGTMIGTGSGFCAYKNNYIVTNFHVINGAKKIKIIDDDKKEYYIDKIEIIKSGDDLAILSGKFSFQPISIDTSDLKAGDNIICIGSPQGQLNTVSTGVVSNADDKYQIRITAPISPGSSGGVLLNKNHKVIGITYAVYNSVEAQNINYAINVKFLEEMYKNLISKECFSLPDRASASNIDQLNKLENLNVFDIYYYVDNLDVFYNATSMKKKFEIILKSNALDWYNIYDTFTPKQKYECVGILEDFSEVNRISKTEDKKYLKFSEAIKNYSFEEIAYEIAVEKYQYAIILEKISTLKNKDEIISMINELPIKDEQKILLKYCCVFQNITQFTDDENKKLTNYLFDEKFNSGYNSEAAVTLLEKMGYRVEKNNNGYKIYWD